MNLKTILILSIVFMSRICVAQERASADTASFSKNNFTIRFPASWRIDSSGLMGSQVFLFSPLENPADQFRENVNVLIQDLAGSQVDLQRYKEITESQIDQMVTDGKLLESNIVKSDRPHYKVVYEMRQGKFLLRIISLCYIRDEKAYLVTFTSELAKAELYNKTGDLILATFVLEK
jgi:hypothetical protein